MALLDQISDLVTRLVPPKAPKPTTSMSGGIGSGHGMVPFDDDVSAISTFFSEPVLQSLPDCAAQPHNRTSHALAYHSLSVGYSTTLCWFFC